MSSELSGNCNDSRRNMASELSGNCNDSRRNMASKLSENCNDSSRTMASELSGNCNKTKSEGTKNEDEVCKMSEEINEMYCEDCEKDLGDINSADGFCEKCFEYLCSTCIRYHKKHLPHHSVQDRANMPKDFCFDKCKKHPSEIIKFYCKLCDIEACALCKHENHEKCTEVSHIPTMVKSEAIADEIREVSKSIDNALEELAMKKNRVSSSYIEVQSNRSEICKAIQNHKESLKNEVFQQHRQLLTRQAMKEKNARDQHEVKRAEIIAKLDKERDELIKQLKTEKESLQLQLQTKCNGILGQINEKAKEIQRESEQNNLADVHNIQVVLSNIDTTKSKVQEMKMSMESRRKTGQKCGLFVAMKHVKSDMKKLNSEEMKTNRETEICNYKFAAKTDDINLENSDNEIAFGHLLDKSGIKRDLEYVGTIKVKPSKKGNKTGITGLCKIDCGLIVACRDINCIKLIDDKQNYEISSIKLVAAPFDVTSVGNNHIASTVPDAKKVMFFGITTYDKLVWINEIDIGRKCYGIDSIKPNLILVACQDPGCIEILRQNGEPIKTLSSFTVPRYLSIDQTSGIFYVEDYENDAVLQSEKWTIKKTNDNGEIQRIIHSNSSNGVTVDNDGAVFVYQKTLLYKRDGPLRQLSRNLENIQTIDTEKHVTGGGSCLYFCQNESKLYIGTTWGKIIVLKVK